MDEVDNSNLKLTLRDLIVYFATVNMKYMGQSIWVKSVKCSEMNNSYEEYYNIGQQYKIFRDIKASTELTYIKTSEEFLLVCFVFVTCNKRSYQISGKLCTIYPLQPQMKY